VQIALLMDEVDKVANNFAKYPPRPPVPVSPTDDSPDDAPLSRPAPVYSDGSKIPTIVCGDYNSVPDSGVYEFLSTGSLAPDHTDWMQYTYGKYTQDGLRHRFGLKSAYAAVGELPMTNCTPNFCEPIDYIWYSTSSIAVNAVLGEVDKAYMDKVVGFPNHHFPSECANTIFSIISTILISLSIVTYVSFPSSVSSHQRRRNHPVRHQSSRSRLDDVIQYHYPRTLFFPCLLSPGYIYIACKYFQLLRPPCPLQPFYIWFSRSSLCLPLSPRRSLVEYDLFRLLFSSFLVACLALFVCSLSFPLPRHVASQSATSVACACTSLYKFSEISIVRGVRTLRHSSAGNTKSSETTVLPA
jgi:hypothetical protein